MRTKALYNQNKEIAWTERAARHRFEAVVKEYHRHSGLSSAAKVYKKGFPTIEFVVDVERICRITLTEKEYRWLLVNILRPANPDTYDKLMEVQSMQFIKLQIKLGRAFTFHGLYPVRKYFNAPARVIAMPKKPEIPRGIQPKEVA